MVKRSNLTRWSSCRLGRVRLDSPWEEFPVQRLRRTAQVRRILPDPIQAGLEGGVQRRRVLLALPAAISPARAEEETCRLVLRTFRYLIWGDPRPQMFEFQEPPRLEEVCPELAMFWPDSWFALEPFSRGSSAVVHYAATNFSEVNMLRALGILEWSLDHQNRLGHSLGLYLWMLLTEEDAEEQLSELTDVVYNFDNNVTDYLYTRHRHPSRSWAILYGNN